MGAEVKATSNSCQWIKEHNFKLLLGPTIIFSTPLALTREEVIVQPEE
jgi:hypothetical protein